MNKKYNVMYGIGHAKYVINTHDGIQKHPGGSEFWGIKIFKNKKKLNACIQTLQNDGYREESFKYE